MTRLFTFVLEAWQLSEYSQGPTHRVYQVYPVHLSYQAQSGDDVAHRKVGRYLGGLALKHQRVTVRAMPLSPAHHCGRSFQQLRRHALPELGQVTALQATLPHQCVDRIKPAVVQPQRAVPDRMGHFACHLALSDVVSHPAKVFQQHHPQRGRQGPQFAQAQLAAILVGVKKSRKYFRIKDAVGVRHIGPGDAVNTRQALQWRCRELRQAGVVAARHTLTDLLQLSLDQWKIVKQPLGGRCGVMATE